MASRWTIPPIRKRYFVYTFGDPDAENKVFYVGKGCIERFHFHNAEAKRGCRCGKCKTVRRIWSSDKQVYVSILFETDREKEAYIYEWGMINILFAGPDLTNEHDNIYHRERLRQKFALDTARFVALPRIKQAQVDYALAPVEDIVKGIYPVPVHLRRRFGC